MSRLHTTISSIPFPYIAIGVTLGPGFLKFALVFFEVGFCWVDHLTSGWHD